ncbi:MAG: ubiE 3 [Deltaproteobacteria bacterium]|nr:ubiE 3 [Deltaproteobacteria bacterium]
MGGRFALKAREHLRAPERKRYFNEKHFEEAARRYDLATRAMSLGRDAAWKRALVAALPDLRAPACVDIACGTGDVAFLLAGRYPGGTVVGVDIAAGMLALAGKRNRFPNVRFEPGDMEALPFADGSVDVLTGSYALRNAPELRSALGEIRRVLADDGTAAILDFSRPESPLLQKLQFLLLKGWCGSWGFLLHGTPEVHGYVAESLAVFPDRGRFAGILRAEGFEVASSRRFFLGITELLLLRKATSPVTGATRGKAVCTCATGSPDERRGSRRPG